NSEHVSRDVPDARAFSRFRLDSLFQDLVETTERRLSLDAFFFGVSAMGDVQAKANPFSDRAICLKNRNSARPMPHIDSITATNPIVGLVKRPRIYRPLPNNCRALAIIRMQRV